MAFTGYGKTQSTFELQTEETTIKRAFVMDTSQAMSGQYTWNAGEIMELYTGAKVRKATTNSTQYILGVTMDDHNSTIDDCAAGKCTVVIGPHIARTKRFNTTYITSSLTPGTLLYADSGTAGYFSTASATSGAPTVGYAISCDGTWLTYVWNQVMAYS